MGHPASNPCHNQRRYKNTAFLIVVTALLLSAPLSFNAYSKEPQKTEKGNIMAAHMLNFLRFTHYKTPALKDAPYITICILGNNCLYKKLNHISGISHQGKIVQINSIREDHDISRCHQLFIGDTNNEAMIIMKSSALGILTFSDKEGFTNRGGIVEFVVRKDKMRFKINTTAMHIAAIELSSRLIELSEGN